MSITRVAKIAGVSHATVSNVINNRPNVRASTAEAVRDAMAQINYKPLPVGLRPGRRPNSVKEPQKTHRITLAWPHRDVRNNPVPMSIMRGVAEELADLGMQLDVTFDGVEQLDRLGQTATKSDGIIVMGFAEQAVIEQIGQTPLMFIGSHGPLDRGDRVRCDHDQVAREAAAYLIEHGHGDVVFINLSPRHPAFVQRKNAFRHECERLGATVHILEAADLVGEPGRVFSGDGAAEVARALSELPLDRIGVFASCDQYLAAVDRECRRIGFDLMNRVTAIACDNDPAALESMVPQPATFDIQPETIGRLAANRLVERINHPFTFGQQTTLVPAKLVEPTP